METPEMNFKFELEENYRSGDPIDEEIASFIVKDDDGKSVLVVESLITLNEQIDSLVINKVAIIVDTDEPTMEIPAKQLAEFLSRLAEYEWVIPGPPVYLDEPEEYLIPMDKPHRIESCYYQKNFEIETFEWLREFLVNGGTIAKILAMIDSEEE